MQTSNHKKKARVAILISDKIDFIRRNTARGKEECFIIKKISLRKF